MITISLCMIVKNEEDVLARCLSSVKDAVDEIIIVDTGSTDRTKEIASVYTDKVYDFAWIDDFSAARNYAFSFATMQYCMWLDADDILKEDDLKKLIQLKHSTTLDTDFIFCKYDVAFDVNGNPTFSYFRERIIKRGIGAVWVEPVHECISAFGKIVYSEVAVTHNKIKSNPKGRNLKIFEKQLKANKELSPRLQYYYARELMYNNQLKKSARIFEKFLKDDKGWIENKIGACKDLANCYKKLGESEKSLNSLLRSLYYDVPRADISCLIGRHFFDKSQYELAKFWYETAANCKQEKTYLGFCEADNYNFTPYIQLCVIHDRLKNYSKAKEYNDKAGEFKPYHPSYLSNKKYFDSIIK